MGFVHCMLGDWRFAAKYVWGMLGYIGVSQLATTVFLQYRKWWSVVSCFKVPWPFNIVCVCVRHDCISNPPIHLCAGGTILLRSIVAAGVCVCAGVRYH